MYNAMYPSHMVVQYNPQTSQVESRRYSRELFHLMNVEMSNTRRREYGFQSHNNNNNNPINLSQNGINSQGIMPPPSHLNFRPILNSSVTEYWDSRLNSTGKTYNRLRHGVSAPCLSTGIGGDESSDSGLSSRSPTPSRQQPQDHNSLEESSEESTCGDTNKQTNKRVQEMQVQSYQYNGSGRGHSNNQKRNDQNTQLYHKRRTNPGRYSSNTSHRGRRIPNMFISSPYLPPGILCPTTYYTAPDRFLSRSYLMQTRSTPSELTNGSSWDALSKSIWRKFMSNQQTEETYRKKMVLWKYLYVFIKSFYPKYGLYLVGSTMTGLGTNTSDVDMCLLVRHCEIDQKNEAITYLDDILKLLNRCDFVTKPDLIQAKVPILKFCDLKQGLEVDLNCNNSVGIRNTHLLYCYAHSDWRVKPLVLVVKLWAIWHNINDAKHMTISSYSLALMVIHFLQCGVSPPILPCLHSLYPEKFSPHSDISSIDIHETLGTYCSENTQTLGELLLQFFLYYTNFDYLQYAISVRLANVIPVEECRHVRTSKNDPHQWKYLCIEEPFDLTNTARSVYDPDAFDRIQRTFSKSYRILMESHSLESLFKIESPA